MWCLIAIEKIKWTDKVSKKGIKRIKVRKSILAIVEKRAELDTLLLKLLHDVTEEQLERIQGLGRK